MAKSGNRALGKILSHYILSHDMIGSVHINVNDIDTLSTAKQ